MVAHFERAWLLFRQGRLEQAEKEIAQGFAQDPGSPLGHAVLAWCLAARQQYEEATREAQEAVGQGPDVPFAHATLARVWFLRRHLDKAETSAAEAIALDPLQPDHVVLQGQIRFARQQWQAAKEAADRALALDPEHVDALNLRAEALRKLGQATSAEDQLIAALAVDPDDAGTHASLGWVYLEQGDRAKAMQHFREALRLDAELESARAGAVETLKAFNPVYRGFLKYIFWMQRLGTQGQWAVILGAWFGYMIVRRVAEANPTAAKWLWPLIAGYLVFVLVTWLAQPLANLALRLHPFGRLALSRDERIGSNWVGGCLLVAIVAAVGYGLRPESIAQDVAIVFGLMLLPLGATFQAAVPWPRKPMIIYTAVVALAGLCSIVVGALPRLALETLPLPLVLLVALAHLLSLLFPWGAVLSLFAGNILMSIRWKQ
ncbi:MAG: tetratricopeptide repeat protein [Pirellulales bacterium]|nr:tetratricopeptide repeat protein [Pirellulales bacterium]